MITYFAEYLQIAEMKEVGHGEYTDPSLQAAPVGSGPL